MAGRAARGPFDPERDAREFHAAHQEAFADHWDYTPRDFEWWSKVHFESERFDPTLWCVVRAGDDIAAGTISTRATRTAAAGSTRSSRVGRGAIGAWARRSSANRSGASRERGEHGVGLGVDTANETGAFRLYERAGMTPVLGWTVYEKELRD